MGSKMQPGPNPQINGGLAKKTRTYFSEDIVRVSNWGYWYEVDGKRLSKMDLSDATILWPNAALTKDDTHARGRLLIVDHGAHYNDMGNPGVCANEEIWLAVNLNGHEFRRQWTPGDGFSFSWVVEDRGASHG